MRNSIETTAADMPMRIVRTRPVLVAAALVALTGAFFMNAGAEGSAREGNAGKETAGPQVEGFRSARFGISMSETLEAIQRDFQLRREDILEQPNKEDRTTSLVATVRDIFPDSEPAQVICVHGYKKKKLIQVNILWGSPVTDEPDPQALVTTANVLRKYFGQLGFDTGKTVMNTRVDDGAFIVFRATDEQQRMVLLQLISRNVSGEEGKGDGKPELQNRVVSLWLSYIEDTVNPDIFRIEKGKF